MSANQPPPLAVIIVNWNLPLETIECLHSLRANGPAEVELIVVDNHSSDDSLAQLAAAFPGTITLLANADNLGFAGGVNAGLRHALRSPAEAILLLNNDTIVDGAMLATLLAAAQALPEAGILSPAIYYYREPERIWRYGDNESPWLPVPREISSRAAARHLPHPFPVDYVTFCGVLIRREVFSRIGLLDERFFMYFEDADFCRRARNAGFQVFSVPAAKMWHKVSLSAARDKPRNRYARSWGRVQFYRTHPHGYLPNLFYLYLLAKLLLTTAGDLCQGEWRLIKPLWHGTLAGFRKHEPKIGRASDDAKTQRER